MLKEGFLGSFTQIVPDLEEIDTEFRSTSTQKRLKFNRLSWRQGVTQALQNNLKPSIRMETTLLNLQNRNSDAKEPLSEVLALIAGHKGEIWFWCDPTFLK